MKILTKSIAFKLANRLGYTVIPNWRLSAHELAQHLKEVFVQQRVDAVIDAGANLGQYRDFLRGHVDYTGPIISFEPVPELFRQLSERAVGDSNWQIFPYALGREDSQAHINVMEADQFSSFLTPDHSKVDDWTEKNVVAFTRLVDVRRLDHLLDEMSSLYDKQRIYLKMDTQGFDLSAFSGAQGIMDRIVGLQSEVSMLPIYHGMPRYAEAIETYQQAGFDVSGMYVVNRDQHLRAVEFDCIMIK